MRRSIATTLITAFLLALLARVQAAWSCPDGTPCIHDQAQGYVCAGNRCAGEASCCRVGTIRCKHGATPSLQQFPASGAGIGTGDHCRFGVSSAPHLTAVNDSAKQLRLAADLALAPEAVELRLSRPAPVWRFEFTLGYRPPPILFLGPSRAPPTA